MRSSALIGLCLLLSACSSSPASQSGSPSSTPPATPPDLGSVAKSACGFPLGAGEIEGRTVVCGTLDVPASYQAPSKGTYHLHVAYFRSATARPGALPVILLLGGPGDTVASYSQSFSTDLLDALGHDVIVFDQRGAGQSDPAPLCTKQVSLLDDPASVTQVLTSCAARMQSHGVDPATFDTLASAEDVERLRQALGLDHIALVGWSYGTRLALQALRAHPNAVSAFVIDSVSTPDQTPPDTKAPLVNGTLSDLIQACKTDAGCNAAYPNLEQQVSETTAALPVPWTAVTGGSFTKVMYAALLLQVMARSTQPLQDAPAYIKRIDGLVVGQGKLPAAQTADLAKALDAATLPMPAMYYSITCSDDQTADPATAQASLAQVRPALASFFQQTNAVLFSGCAAWPYAKHPASAFTAVKSSVPALVMTARFDTLTPTSWADHAASTLARSTTVRFSHAAHIVTATDTTGCALSILKAFLDNPGGRLDTSCAR